MRRLLSAALLVTVVAVAAPAAALPIPSDPRDLLLEPFTGSPVKAKPYPAQKIPQNPFMAANARSNLHLKPRKQD